MYFEARELVSHAEPVSSEDLREGEVYYAITYIDEYRC